MKIFSMLFTILLFFGFTNITYAKPVYTVTNKLEKASKASVEIFLATVYGDSYGQPYIDVDYTAEPGTCLYVNEDDFDRLMVTLSYRLSTETDARGSITLCSPGHDTCKEANNYEIIYDDPWWSQPEYTVETVDKPNTNHNCIDIRRWMRIKEREHFNNK